MNIAKIFPFIVIAVFIYACQPSAIRETVEPHPVTEEGLIASSLYAAEKTGSDDIKSDILSRTALMKAGSNNMEAALEYASRIPSQNIKDRTLAEIAISINEQGNRDRAQIVAGTIRSDYEKSRVLADIAVGYERAEEYRRGRELAEGIPDPNLKARAVADIAVIYNAVGYDDLATRLFNQSLRAARTEQSLTHHIETLLYIAERYNEAGRQERGREVFADVRRLSEQVGMEQHVVNVWDNILQSYRMTGSDDSIIDDALAIARNMNEADGYYRDELFSRIAAAIAVTNDFQRSQSITDEIADLPLRSTTYARLAVLAYEQENTGSAGELLSEAVITADMIPDGTFKQRALRDIGKKAGDIRRFDTVDRLIETVEDPYYIAGIAANAADVALREGDEDTFSQYLKMTIDAFDSIDDPINKSEVLFEIAALHEKSGTAPNENTKLIVSKALHAVD